MENEIKPPCPIIGWFNRVFRHVDEVILIVVSIGIVALAVLVLLEGLSDFINLSEHSFPHITSDLMFVLILMELFRQVLRQINREAFSLNPFLFIGVIASIRSILITQMGLGLKEIEWSNGVWQLAVNAGLVIIMVVCYYITSKAEKLR